MRWRWRIGLGLVLTGLLTIEVGLWSFFLDTNLTQRAAILGVGTAVIAVGYVLLGRRA